MCTKFMEVPRWVSSLNFHQQNFKKSSTINTQNNQDQLRLIVIDLKMFSAFRLFCNPDRSNIF